MGPNLLHRRDFLKVSLSAPAALSSIGMATAETRQKLLPMIIVFCAGGISGKESWNPDPPGTSEDLRGPLQSIPTKSEARFCELFPRMANHADQLAVLRAIDTESADHFVSMDHLLANGKTTLASRHGEKAAQGGVPYGFIHLPSFYGVGAAQQTNLSLHINWNEKEQMWKAPETKLDPHLLEKKALLESFEQGEYHTKITQGMTRNRELAFSLLTGGGKFFSSFNLPEKDRERYGKTKLGDGVLLARRLIEAGSGVVTVHDEENTLKGAGYDMHSDIKEKMQELGPRLDQAVSALLEDMKSRLECVLLVATEFNRTPKMNDSGGRDHFTISTAMLAGGKIKGGSVYGRTDKMGVARDGYIKQKDTVANTAIIAAGGEVDPAEQRVREILYS